MTRADQIISRLSKGLKRDSDNYVGDKGQDLESAGIIVNDDIQITMPGQNFEQAAQAIAAKVDDKEIFSIYMTMID